MRWTIPAATATALLAVAAPAVAAWTASGSGSGGAAAVQLGAPGAATASGATTSSLTITWVAATAFASGSIGYWVQRAPFGGSTWADACGTAEAATTAGLSCTDSGLEAGTDYQYRVTSVFHAWRRTGATSAKLSTTAAATYTYSLAPVVAGSKVAGTSFAVSVSRSDSFTGTAPITLSGSNPSPSGQAAVYPAAGTTVTFVNGVSTAPVLSVTLYRAGSNTIDVTDGTRTGSGVITVTPAAATNLAFTGVTFSSANYTSAPSATCVSMSCNWAPAGNDPRWESSVSVTDTYGNVGSNVGSPLTVALTANVGSLSATSVTIPASGPATSSGFTWSHGTSNYTLDLVAKVTPATYTQVTAKIAKN